MNKSVCNCITKYNLQFVTFVYESINVYNICMFFLYKCVLGYKLKYIHISEIKIEKNDRKFVMSRIGDKLG